MVHCRKSSAARQSFTVSKGDGSRIAQCTFEGNPSEVGPGSVLVGAGLLTNEATELGLEISSKLVGFIR